MAPEIVFFDKPDPFKSDVVLILKLLELVFGFVASYIYGKSIKS